MTTRRPAKPASPGPASPWKQMAACRTAADYLALAERLEVERSGIAREIEAHALDVAWQKCEYPAQAARLGDCRDVSQACRERAGRIGGTT